MKNIQLIDTNIILRFFLKDNLELWEKATQVISAEEILILDSVMAEVIYVLQKLYNIPREKISSLLLSLCNLKHVSTENGIVTMYAIEQYGILNLDFVDLLLYSHKVKQGINVQTLDKKLGKLINQY